MTTTDADLASQLTATLEHLNANHGDTVLFLARHLTGDPGLVDAEIVGADLAGTDLFVVDGVASRTVRIDFAAELVSLTDVQGEMFGQLAAARAADPDGELTSMEREMAEQGTIPTRVVTVTAVVDLAPDLCQITVGGLRGHMPLGPEDFFLAIRPREGFEHQLDDGLSFADFQALPEDQSPGWAYYTCRRFRPDVGEMDLWFVLHDHDGPLSGWARHAAAGDRIALWGPRRAFEPPQDATAYLLVGDETGLAAFAAVLDHADGGAPVTVIVESDGGTPVVELPARPKDTVQWVSRDGGERGTGTALVDAVAALTLDTVGLYAYGAAESREVTAVRKHLRHTLAMPAEQVQMVGYWRRTE